MTGAELSLHPLAGSAIRTVKRQAPFCVLRPRIEFKGGCMPRNFLHRFSPVRVVCYLFAGLSCAASIWGCGGQPGNTAVSLEGIAKKVKVSLPPAGVGPVKLFASEAVQDGSSPRRFIYFEWPDGTEELRGQTYDRTKITTVESGGSPFVEFRYSRRDGERIFGIEKRELGFGEYFSRPAHFDVGKRWHSSDKSEDSDCRVVANKALEVGGHHYDQCLEINCKQRTRMPDGELFKGTTTTQRCRGIGVVKLDSESSNGKVTIKISEILESYSWNGAEPSDT